MTALSLFYEWNWFCSVLGRVDLGRIYCSIAQDLKCFGQHRSHGNVGLLGNTNIGWCREHQGWQIFQLLSFLISLGKVGYFHKGYLCSSTLGPRPPSRRLSVPKILQELIEDYTYSRYSKIKKLFCKAKLWCPK